MFEERITFENLIPFEGKAREDFLRISDSVNSPRCSSLPSWWMEQLGISEEDAHNGQKLEKIYKKHDYYPNSFEIYFKGEDIVAFSDSDGDIECLANIMASVMNEYKINDPIPLQASDGTNGLYFLVTKDGFDGGRIEELSPEVFAAYKRAAGAAASASAAKESEKELVRAMDFFAKAADGFYGETKDRGDLRVLDAIKRLPPGMLTKMMEKGQAAAFGRAVGQKYDGNKIDPEFLFLLAPEKKKPGPKA